MSLFMLLENDLDSVQDPDNPGVDLNQIEKEIVGSDGLGAHEEEIEDAIDGVVEEPLEEAFMIMYESESNYNRLLEAIGMHELKLMSRGREPMLEASGIKEFFAKVKENIVKMFKKIVEVFKKAINYLKAFFTSSKKFVSKYKSQIEKGFTKLESQGKFKDKKGYPFDFLRTYNKFAKLLEVNENNTLADVNAAKYENALKEPFDSSKYTTDIIRDNYASIWEKVLDKKDITTPGEAKKLLLEKLYGEKKEIMDCYKSGADLVKDLDNKDIDEIKKAYNKIKTQYNDAIKKIDEMAKKKIDTDYKSDDPGARHADVIAHFYCKILQDNRNAANIVSTAYISAAKARIKQARSLANHCVAAAGVKVTESYRYSGSGSLFGNIDII